MRLRVLGAAAVAVLAAATLSACRTNVGLAASVDGHEISESQVNSYLRPDGSDKAALAKLRASAAQDNQTVNLPEPRAFVLQTLIGAQLEGNTLRAGGGIPSARQLAKVHEQLSTSGVPIDKSVRLGFRAIGVRSALIPDYVLGSEYQVSIGRAIKASTVAQLSAYVSKHGGRVQLNPRYGTWDESTLSIDTTGSAGTPGFLTLQPTTGAGGS